MWAEKENDRRHIYVMSKNGLHVHNIKLVCFTQLHNEKFQIRFRKRLYVEKLYGKVQINRRNNRVKIQIVTIFPISSARF